MPTRCRNWVVPIVLLTTSLASSAFADQSGTATLTMNSYLSFDSGAVSGSAGDVLWNGSSLSPQGHAGIYNLGKYGSRAFQFLSARSASSVPFGVAAIPGDALVAGDVFGVYTNGGHYAKVMIIAASGTSLSVKYTTFGRAQAKPAAAGPVPIITAVQNNYSYLLPGVPNYGIAPGSIFVIVGQLLSSGAPPVLQSSAAPGLPLALNGTSISVTVNGITTTPALYYTSSAQLAAVLPSTTPVGDGTVTVTYNGVPSAPAPIHVVPTALGLDTLYGSGNGSGVATDGNGKAFGFLNSATPKQVITLWGSGIGADTSSDDRTYPQKQNNLTNIPLQVFIGGMLANVSYSGRSQYPGLDQVNVTIPSNVPLGCFVSVVAQSGSVVSNAVTLPVSSSAGPCSDPALGLTGAQLQALAAKSASAVNALSVLVFQATNLDGTTTGVGAFSASANSSLFGAGYYYASLGSCVVIPPHAKTQPFGSPLDAGTLRLTSPAGNITLTAGGGQYSGQLPAGSLTKSPGTYTISGSGGANVGSFSVAINVQTPLTLTNTNVLASITRSQGATVTWTGGFQNGYVVVQGVGNFFPVGSANFFCFGPSSAGQLTIPPSILLALPPGGGNLFVLNTTAGQSIAASGLDLGLAIAGVSFEVPTTFK